MKILRPISIVSLSILQLLMLAAGAARRKFRWRLPARNPRRRRKPAAKPKPKAARDHAKKPRQAAQTKPAAAPAATVTPAPAPDDPNVDLVYGAYQRGQYKTAFDLATKRAQERAIRRR